MDKKNLTAVTMPKWGMSMTSGKIAGWLKEEGERIEKGDELIDIETDKIVNTLESNTGGVLVRRIAVDDEELPVGALLGVVSEANVAESDIRAFVSQYQDKSADEKILEEAHDDLQIRSIDGISLAYREIPAVQDQACEAVVLIHGFGGDQNSWLFNVNALREDNRLLTVDLPGHGASARQVGKGTLAEMSALVSGLLDQLGMRLVHIIGHSMGAAVAVKLAQDCPARVSSLSLVGGAGEGTRINRDYVEGFIAANRRRELKPFLQQLFYAPGLVNREMIENILKARRMEGTQQCLEKLAESTLFSSPTSTVAENLSLLTMPVQLIWGKQDQVAPVSNVAGLHGRERCVLLEKVGHMAHMEAASEVNAIVRTFIKESSSE